jgi:hypothetical protein
MAEWAWEDHRVSDSEIEEDTEPFRRMAKEFLYSYYGDWEFLLSVQEQVHRLSVRQIRGVINCMRAHTRGTEILQRGPCEISRPACGHKYCPDDRCGYAPVIPTPEPLWIKEICPLVRTRQEHDRHHFPLRSKPGSSKHCLGWHRMTRTSTLVRARFHAPFVRGAKSNLLHRSTHVGWVLWMPDNFHQPGQAYVYEWWVGRACTRHAAPLKCPDTLTVEEARAARPHVGPGIQHDALTLCPQCFPGTRYEVVGVPEKGL